MRRFLILLALIISVVTITTAQRTGKMSGKLTYPSDYIPPDMVLCVESPGKAVCSNSTSKPGFVFRINTRAASYEITLPAGKYHLYGRTSEMQGVKAYYNEFVKCGMDVKCKSKRKIQLDVKAGKTIRGITVGDWY